MKPRIRPVIGLLAAPLPIIALAAVPAFAATPDAQSPSALRGDVVSAVSHSVRTGDVAADQQISVAVSLTQRDTAGLDAFLNQVTDPNSPSY